MSKVSHATATQEEIESRIATLKAMAVLDTPPEESFDSIARLASVVCDAPLAMVSLVDGKRLWFKSVVGVETRSIDSHRSFCGQAANSKSLLAVGNARLDPRFANNGLVDGELGIQTYAGAPIVVNGVGVGTVCVLDRVPRQFTDRQTAALTDLASVALAILRARIEAFKLLSDAR